MKKCQVAIVNNQESFQKSIRRKLLGENGRRLKKHTSQAVCAPENSRENVCAIKTRSVPIK